MAQYDTSIYQNLLSGVRSPESFAAERQQVEASALTNALNRQKADAYSKEQNLLNTFRAARQRGASADELVGMGDYEGAKERQAFETNKVEESRKAEKWTQDKVKFVLGVQKDLAGRVMANPSAQSAMSAIAEMERISGQNMDSERQKVAMLQSPDDIRRWAASHALTADQMLPKFETLNTGGAIQDRRRDPITGAVTVAGSTPLTMTPGQAIQRDNNIRSNERMAANAGGGVGGSAKPPAGYRYKPDGSLEAIPGGPADLKAQAQSQKIADGSKDVDVALATLRDAYDRLDKGGGITSTSNRAGTNLGASLSSSGMGQTIGKMFGTDNQSARNDIAMARPALLAALMKATGMSAKQMDSNAELKLWLSTATDPTLDIESNRRALANIERKYVVGQANATPVAPAPKGGLTAEEQAELEELRNRFKRR